MNEADLKQVETLIRERVRDAMTELVRSADWYTSGFRAVISAAHLLKDAAEMTARNLAPEPEPKPVNPLAPKLTAEQWADRIKSLISEAKADGMTVYFDASGDVSGHAWLGLRVGAEDSPVDADPLVWENR